MLKHTDIYTHTYTHIHTYISTPRRRAKKKKGIEALRVKPSTLFRTLDALVEDENRMEKRKRKLGADPQRSYPGLFGSLLRPARIPRGVYSFNPLGLRGCIYRWDGGESGFNC